ncbi:MAG: DUF4760 domain-containing protein [Agriterribacter sp.]
MQQQALSTYEIWTLVLQIIGTVATVAACVGIYYAEKSLDLARHDYARKLRLETGAYARQIMKDLRERTPLMRNIIQQNLTPEQAYKNDDIRLDLSDLLNFLESVAIDVKEGLYDNDYLQQYLQMFTQFYREFLLNYISYAQQMKENTRLWMFTEQLLASNTKI